jgi:hypothetical protein
MRKLSASLLVCLLSGGLVWLDARAQEPAAGTIFFQKLQLRIPFPSQENDPNIKQFRLFVSTDQGNTWKLSTSVGRNANHFLYTAPQDGLYWFAMQVEGNNGAFYPASEREFKKDILRVIIDSTPPMVRVQPLSPRNGEVGVSWKITDDNLDSALPDSVRVEYRLPGGGNWIPLKLPLAATQIYWNPQANGVIEVRVLARDRAGNVGEDRTTVNLAGNQGLGNPVNPGIAPPIVDPFKDVERKFVNNKQISLTYDLRDVGPSGVSAIELWYTLPKNRSWHKLTEYPVDLKNPDAGQTKKLTFEVQDEGIYGITLVAKSGVGLGERAPQVGERPQFWLEVDTTKPVVQILGVQVGHGADKGKLTTLWNARDKNLGPTPIRISCAEQRDGPWNTFADKIANTGKHTWTMPGELPYQFYIRVEAIDLANNIGEAITQDKVKVDLSLPKARPIDIVPGG